MNKRLTIIALFQNNYVWIFILYRHCRIIENLFLLITSGSREKVLYRRLRKWKQLLVNSVSHIKSCRRAGDKSLPLSAVFSSVLHILTTRPLWICIRDIVHFGSCNGLSPVGTSHELNQCKFSLFLSFRNPSFNCPDLWWLWGRLGDCWLLM